MRWGATVILAAALAVVIAGSADASRNLYRTGDASTDEIFQFGFTADGGLTPSSAFATSQAGGPYAVALSPDGRELYVSLISANQVAGFSVGDNGGLFPLPGSPFTTTTNPRGIAVSPNGKFLYVAGPSANGVVMHTIGADGALSAPSPVVSTGASSSPFELAITADGSKLYASLLGAAKIAGFVVAADGSLSPLAGSPFTAPTSGGLGLAITPDGAHLYEVTQAAAGVYGYSLAADGSLSPISGSPFPGGPGTRAIAITGDGSHLYETNTAGGAGQGTWGYNVAADGSLSPVAGSPFAPAATDAIALTPDSRRLYAGASFNGNTYGFDVGPGGSLTAVPGGPFTTTASGSEAFSMAMPPDQPPIASFSATPGLAGAPSAFDASASTDPDGTVARYDWDFGDGSTLADGGVSPEHVYAGPGTYHVTVTATDNEGCSTSFISTGQTALCNGSGVARTARDIDIASPVVPDTTPPDLELSGKKKQKVGGSLSVGVSCDEACTATGSGRITLTGGGGHDRSARKHSLKLKPKTISLAAGVTGTVRLKIRKPIRSAIARAFDGGDKATARIAVTATDSSGNATTKRTRVKLVER